jgi:hypothetical protein
LLDDNEAKPPSIVAYLRKRNNVVTALLTLLSQGNLTYVTIYKAIPLHATKGGEEV